MNKMQTKIFNIVNSIKPHDETEQTHIEDVKHWTSSGAAIFRISKPDIPPKHLVSYFLLVDVKEKKVLLVHHRKAALWLPAGGHVEPEEHPTATVERELQEELGITAEFLSPSPVFCTITQTVGLTAGHTDVSLWYVLKGDSTISLDFDDEEFFEIRWFSLADIPFGKSDPHMKRLINKIYPKGADEKFTFNHCALDSRELCHG